MFGILGAAEASGSGSWISIVIDVGTPIIVALLSWLSAKLVGLINEKTKNEALKGILHRLDDAVFSAVSDVMMSTVDAAKAADKNGKLPAEVAQAAKAAAIAKVRSFIGPEGIAMLKKVLGLGTSDLVDAFIGSKVEAQVRSLKSVDLASADANVAASQLATLANTP